MRSPLFYLCLAALGLWFADRHRRADETFMMSVMAIGSIMMLTLAIRALWRGRGGSRGSGQSPG